MNEIPTENFTAEQEATGVESVEGATNQKRLRTIELYE